MSARRPHRPTRRPRRGRNRGVAMLAVLTAVAICLVIVNEFGTRTTIDLMQSRNNLDQMRSSFLARSSLNITELILRLQGKIDGLDPALKERIGMGDVQITEFADPLMMAFGGDAEQVEGAVGLSMTDAKGLGADIGTFGVRIKPVDGKINLNCAYDPSTQKLVASTIESLIYPAAFDPLFEEPDADGWRRDRKTQLSAIIDYIDRDNFKLDVKGNGVYEASSAPEDYGYGTLRDPYKPKNNYLDSVSELRLVRGVDDRFMTLFGGAFRVHGDCKINLRALDDPKVIVAIMVLSANDRNDPVLSNPVALWAIANLMIQMKQFGMTFDKTDDFIEFAGKPAEKMAEYAAAGTDPNAAAGGQSAAPAGLPQLPPGVTGIELKKTELEKIVTAGPVVAYEVEAWGEITRDPFLPIRRTMKSVWDQIFPISGPNKRSPLAEKGMWLFLREE